MRQKHHRRSQRGYILLFLVMFIAILSIGFLEAAKYDLQYTIQQIKRDREEELIHRGVEYSRAIRKFYKKFGRYPTRIEELESTNNYRSLRKRYKDPVTGKDFKLLHLTDVQMSFGGGLTGPGLTPVSQMNQQAGAPGALDGGVGGATGSGPGPIGGAQNTNVPAPAQNSDAADQNAAQNDTSGSGQAVTTGNPAAPGAMPQPLSQQVGANGQPQVFGGGGIVGVASVSKDKTVREFCKLNHYNKWQFIYNPTMDRGGLLISPYQSCQKALGQFNQNQQNQPSGQNQVLSDTPLAQPPQTPEQPQQSEQQ